MAAKRAARDNVGSPAWIAAERASALELASRGAEDFTFMVRNEMDWLNEHMKDVFNENRENLFDVFKTPAKLRGKTPRTAKRPNNGEPRAPLSDIFSATPKGAANPFAIPSLNNMQTPKLKIAEDRHLSPSPRRAGPAKDAAASPKPPATARQAEVSVLDSGYHGSQPEDVMDVDEDIESAGAVGATAPFASPAKTSSALGGGLMLPMSPLPVTHQSPTQPTAEASFHSAKEEQTKTARVMPPPALTEEPPQSPPVLPLSSPSRSPRPGSPGKSSPAKESPQKASPHKSSPAKSPAIARKPLPPTAQALDSVVVPQQTETQSPSDGSSPIRPIVRKSSLNFASLPAREPLTSTKSIGGRMSRISHLDQTTRQSYYNRPTGGKSLGNVHHDASDEDNDDMDIDDDLTAQNTTDVEAKIAAHNKTYTQRLQDQISMLGKSHSSGSMQSKPLRNSNALSQNTQNAQPTQPSYPQLTQQPQQTSQHSQPSQPSPTRANIPSSPPKKGQPLVATPGAFPEEEEEEEEDDWIAPPAATQTLQTVTSPRPPVPPKSYSTDIMEGLAGKTTIGGSDFVLPKQRLPGSRDGSPKRVPAIPDRTTSALGHTKSASVPFLPASGFESADEHDPISPKKTMISVSNPTLSSVPEDDRPYTPSKSPSRSFRDSPLKQVKNKLSSILKSSKGLLASSAALSAEGKSSLLSPSTSRLGLHFGPSVESLAPKSGLSSEPLYPDLSQHVPAGSHSGSRPVSPARPNARKTRASAEREKREQKQKDKEAKEAQRMADQMGKLEKAREKEREKARVFSKEQERVAAIEKHMEAQKEQERMMEEMQRQVEAQREQERLLQEAQAAVIPPSPTKETPRATRTSPRKGKGQVEAEAEAPVLPSDKFPDNDVDMSEAPALMPPPSVPRSATQSAKAPMRRPVRPTKEAPSRSKQAPTVIRVNTTSQHSQLHPSNSVLAATLQDTLGSQPSQLKSKASVASLHTKQSMQSLKSSVSSSGRPKALELAARRKEQEEREAERKREAKLEMERKREQQRRQEAERQKEEERRQAAAVKKNAQRQTAIERAKQTRAPPPAQRSQQNGRPEYNNNNNNGPGSIARPPSRLDTNMHQRSQEDLSRSVVKPGPKRPLSQDDDPSSRQGPARAGPSYQAKESKRIRISEEFDVDELEMGGVMTTSQSNIKAPPVRPSGGFKKDPPKKSLFTNGYTTVAAASQGATRDLFKTTVTNQHNSNQGKAAHPLDMAQMSKGPIPFAPNPNPNAAGAGGASTSHKTPARPGAGAGAGPPAKSATRSSPRFQNGEAIELPEIQTDDEDSDNEGGDHIGVAPWADSPDLRKALMRQETMDPMNVFGPPAPLNMEEVFSKTKDRWSKFRARTSSANWSGADRLTEDDIRKDLIAREKIRREGGWSYELSRDMA